MTIPNKLWDVCNTVDEDILNWSHNLSLYYWVLWRNLVIWLAVFRVLFWGLERPHFFCFLYSLFDAQVHDNFSQTVLFEIEIKEDSHHDQYFGYPNKNDQKIKDNCIYMNLLQQFSFFFGSPLSKISEDWSIYWWMYATDEGSGFI